LRVDRIANENQSQAVATCDPMMNTPRKIGSIFENMVSIGWQYIAVTAIGAVHS
jgi:hypothetical protein